MLFSKKKAKMRKNKGMTLTENLVAVVLLAVIVISTIGGFVIAKMGAIRAKHRTLAAGFLREYMEKEIASGYNGGQYMNDVFNAGTAVAKVDPTDNMSYSVEPYAIVIMNEGVRSYKRIGFRVRWNEPIYGGAGSISCSESAVTNIADHS